MAVKQIKSLVQFSRGTSLVWDALDTTLPDGVIVFSLDDGIFKLGDGVNNYQNLPTLFTYGQLVSAQGGSSNMFIDPTVEQNGEIVTIALVDGSLRYTASGVTLASVLADIDALEANNTAQDAAIAVLLAKVLKIDVSITTGPDDNLVTISGGKYVDSNESVASIIAAAEAANTTVPGPHLEEPIFYTTAEKQVVVSKLALTDDSIVYCDVVGFHDGTNTPVFGLTCDNPNVTVANVAGSLFSLTITSATLPATNRPLLLTASVDDGTGNSKVSKAIACEITHPDVLVSLYGGADNEYFYGSTIDSKYNIICVGVDYTESGGSYGGLVVKFDTNLNILAKKIYGGTNTGDADGLYAVAVDSSDNIFCVGYTDTEGAGGNDATIVKFDTNLNRISAKVYGGAVSDIFYGVTIDSNGNVFCVGSTNSQGVSGFQPLIVKFDNDLNELAAKVYGTSANTDYFIDVTVDSNDNVFVAGYSGTATTGSYDGLVVKFDNNLNKLISKHYGGTDIDHFKSIAIDSNGNVFCCGDTRSEGVALVTAMVVKFDNNLNKLAGKNYSGTNPTSGDDRYHYIAIDSNDNVVCVGYSNVSGIGGADCFIMKFDNSLSLIAAKIYAGSGSDDLRDVELDANNNIFCVGFTQSDGQGSNDALIFKLPENIPSGTFAGTVITGLTMQDVNLDPTDSNLTIADSTVVPLDSTLVLGISNLVVADSNLTQEKDILG